MYGALKEDLTTRLAEVRAAGTYKSELVMTTPQGAHVDVAGRGALLNMCANNYLGIASHPAMVEAAQETARAWSYAAFRAELEAAWMRLAPEARRRQAAG